MNKDKVSTQELIKQLAKRLNINEKLAEDFLKAMFSTIEEELLKGELVKVKNLGTFKLQWNDPRKSVDVTTGDEIMLEGYNKITFTPDSKLKDLVNEPFAYLEPVLLDSDSPVLEPVKTDDGFDTLNILSGQAAEIKSLLSEISALSENNTQQEDETEPHDDDELNIELSEMQYNIGEEKVEKEDASSEPEWIEDENDESLNLDTELTTPIDTEKDAKVENVESILASVESAEDKGIAGVENEEIKPAGQSVSEVEVISHQPETEESANEQVEDKPEENAEELTRRNRGEMLRAASVRKEVPFQMLGQPGILSTPEPFTLRVKSNGKRNRGCLIFILVSFLLVGGFIVNYYLSSATRCWIKYTLLSEETAHKITNIDETVADWFSGFKSWFTDDEVPEIPIDEMPVEPELLPVESDTLVADTLIDSVAVDPVAEVVDSLKILFDGPRKYNKFMGTETIKQGSRLTLIAERYYGLKDFWVYIYEANKDRIANPDNLPLNVEIRIPQVDKRLIDKDNPDCIKKAKELHDLYVKRKSN